MCICIPLIQILLHKNLVSRVVVGNIRLIRLILYIICLCMSLHKTAMVFRLKVDGNNDDIIAFTINISIIAILIF